MSRTLAAGLVTGFQSRPVFRGPCRLGYRRVQVINSTGSIEVDRYGKVRTVLQKDPSVLGVMQELARQFDAQPNLRAICRAMHSAEWAAPWKPITGGYVWRSARLKSLLSDSIYEGIWRFEPSSRPATLWAEVSRYSGIEHKIPELAWYSSSQMSRWRDKFLGGAAAFARGVHDHPLFGVIACANCHELLSKNGKNGYRCANYGRRCGPGLFVKDKLALQAIDEAIPLLIARIENPAHVIGTADIGNRMAAVELEYGELENRLSFLENFQRNSRGKTPIWIAVERRALTVRKTQLSRDLESACAATLVCSPISFDFGLISSGILSTLSRNSASGTRHYCCASYMSALNWKARGTETGEG